MKTSFEKHSSNSRTHAPRGSRWATGVALSALCLTGVAACGEPTVTAAPNAKAEGSSSASANPTTDSTLPPASSQAPSIEHIPTAPPVTSITTAIEGPAPVAAADLKCTGFEVADLGDGRKKVSAVMTGSFPSLKSVVSFVDTYEDMFTIGSGPGLDAIVEPPYAADLVPGNQDPNGHFNVIVLDYSTVPGGLPTPPPKSTADAPDSVTSFRCVL